MCSGPVELAAAGVSISLLNQASRITIFPLVSITTSFVAEEDTLEKLNAQNGNKSKLKEMTMPEDQMLQDLENNTLKENINTSAKPVIEKSESKENNYATRDNDTETGDGNFSLILPLFIIFKYQENLLIFILSSLFLHI